MGFAAKIKNYEGGLFTWGGTEIQDVHRFVEKFNQGPNGSLPRKGEGKGSGQGNKGGGGLFKGDGTEIKNPVGFVAKIKNYEGGLFTASGTEIQDVHRFVEKFDQGPNGSLPRKGEGKGSGQGNKGGGGLFKGDGTEIKNP